jgi:hypothetical protein
MRIPTTPYRLSIHQLTGHWRRNCIGLLASAALAGSMPAQAAFTVFEATGTDPVSITAARDGLRSAIGGGTTAAAHGDFGGLRREINWDGVPDARTDPNLLPGDFFNTTSPRGAVLGTPGSGFLVSANSGGAVPDLFGFPGDLQAFSAQKLFGIVGSNTMDIRFFVPGTNTAATTSAFGAVFVDLENNDAVDFTTMRFFDRNDNEIFSRTVLATNVTRSLSFLGAVANAGEQIARVTITTPNNYLLANGIRLNETHDFVIMDDFIYATPAAVPEPGIWAMLLVGTGLLAWRARRLNSRAAPAASRTARLRG